MKAVCWYGKKDVRVAEVPEPRVVNPRDAVIRTSLAAICGSDLHLYDGYVPTMQAGDVLGHEFMGIVEEVGSGVDGLRPGDRVIVPFAISCGRCFYCERQLFSLCDNSNPNAWMPEKLYGSSPAGLFGYSHMYGGYAGGQAQRVRVPFADVGAIKVPDEIPDEQALFLTDIFPTGYQAAKFCEIEPGDTVAVWGCGPVGQFVIRSCFLLGAERVIAIDHFPARLALAEAAGAEIIDFEDEHVHEQLMDLTGGRGPDACVDAVGLEAHGTAIDALYDRLKVATGLATDRIHVLRQAIRACRKGGRLSVPGVYGGFADKFPIGALFGKGLTLRGGQTHVHKWIPELLDHVRAGRIDPSFIISHQVAIDDVPEAYVAFSEQQDRCIKVVVRP